jgi:hypothetical protein
MAELKKIKVWWSIQNGGDGSASPAWFLTEEHADKDQGEMDEGWGESCIGSVETFIGSDIHKEASKNSTKYLGKHEYLKAADYYESRSVGTRAKSDKVCEQCGKAIKMGTPHLTHHFYPEYESVPTHIECEKEFKKSLN